MGTDYNEFNIICGMGVIKLGKLEFLYFQYLLFYKTIKRLLPNLTMEY